MQAMLRSGLHRLLADSIRLRATGRHERAERAVKGYLEEVRTDHVKGWAFDRRQPGASPRVRVLLGNAVIAEDVATSDRPDVAKVMGVPAARCGFRVKVDLAAEALDKVAVQASTFEDTFRPFSTPPLTAFVQPAASGFSFGRLKSSSGTSGAAGGTSAVGVACVPVESGPSPTEFTADTL